MVKQRFELIVVALAELAQVSSVHVILEILVSY